MALEMNTTKIDEIVQGVMTADRGDAYYIGYTLATQFNEFKFDEIEYWKKTPIIFGAEYVNVFVLRECHNKFDVFLLIVESKENAPFEYNETFKLV